MEIDDKYKINKIGKYHAGVNWCPYCNFEPDNLPDNIIGFADNFFTVIECPKCFENWYFHIRLNECKYNHYWCFLNSIQDNTNIHFKTNK